jgi:hypothetical protein
LAADLAGEGADAGFLVDFDGDGVVVVAEEAGEDDGERGALLLGRRFLGRLLAFTLESMSARCASGHGGGYHFNLRPLERELFKEGLELCVDRKEIVIGINKIGRMTAREATPAMAVRFISSSRVAMVIGWSLFGRSGEDRFCPRKRRLRLAPLPLEAGQPLHSPPTVYNSRPESEVWIAF